MQTSQLSSWIRALATPLLNVLILLPVAVGWKTLNSVKSFSTSLRRFYREIVPKKSALIFGAKLRVQRLLSLLYNTLYYTHIWHPRPPWHIFPLLLIILSPPLPTASIYTYTHVISAERSSGGTRRRFKVAASSCQCTGCRRHSGVFEVPAVRVAPYT